MFCVLWVEMFHSDREKTEARLLCTLQQDESLLETCFAAFGYDSLNSSRPICSPAETPTQIEQMFDTISYEKVCKTILGVTFKPLLFAYVYTSHKRAHFHSKSFFQINNDPTIINNYPSPDRERVSSTCCDTSSLMRSSRVG